MIVEKYFFADDLGDKKPFRMFGQILRRIEGLALGQQARQRRLQRIGVFAVQG